MPRKIDISHKTIFFITGFLALLWALFLIRDVIILLFLSIILMAGLSPIVEFLERVKIPKGLAIALTYVVIFSLIFTLLYVVITPLTEQTTNLISNFPQTVEKIFPQDGFIDRSILNREVENLTGNAVGFTLSIFNSLLGFISVLVITFYLLLERDKLDKLIAQFFGHEEKVQKITQQIESKLGAWMRGQLALSFIVGGLVYIVLFLLNIPYALPLSILAGILEVVPVIGPIISSIPAIIVAYTLSPVIGLITAIAFFVIQQLENHIIVPQVMKKAVGLNPLIVILAVSIGGKLLGFSGALLAVPISAVIQIITEGVLREEKS